MSSLAIPLIALRRIFRIIDAPAHRIHRNPPTLLEIAWGSSFGRGTSRTDREKGATAKLARDRHGWRHRGRQSDEESAPVLSKSRGSETCARRGLNVHLCDRFLSVFSELQSERETEGGRGDGAVTDSSQMGGS